MLKRFFQTFSSEPLARSTPIMVIDSDDEPPNQMSFHPDDTLVDANVSQQVNVDQHVSDSVTDDDDICAPGIPEQFLATQQQMSLAKEDDDNSIDLSKEVIIYYF